FYFQILTFVILYAVALCGAPSKPKPKAQKTPAPTAPEGVPLGGSGERDDDTLRNVRSLPKEKIKSSSTS
ncbi:hypothetical protein PFISCL1PPCAC_9383, partial [Pristionchus fissidentatus]